MYTNIGNGYQTHLPAEDDRAWVEECLAGNAYWTVDTIFNAASPDETLSTFKIARIFSYSETGQKLGIVLHEVVKPMDSLVNYGIVVHPDHRQLGIGHSATEQLLRWDRDQNIWNLQYIYFVFESTWDTTFLGNSWTKISTPPYITCFAKISEISL